MLMCPAIRQFGPFFSKQHWPLLERSHCLYLYIPVDFQTVTDHEHQLVAMQRTVREASVLHDVALAAGIKALSTTGMCGMRS